MHDPAPGVVPMCSAATAWQQRFDPPPLRVAQLGGLAAVLSMIG
jgi:hypothetical protein